MIDSTEGWFSEYQRKPIFHRGKSIKPTGQIIHYAGDGNGRSIARWAAGVTVPQVSWHFMACKDGHVIQQRSIAEEAWHAGVSEWRDVDGETRSDCNHWTIGIELEGNGREPYPEPQIVALEALLRKLRGYMPLNAAGHDEVAMPLGRKVDPGQYFPWERFEWARMWPRRV